jgi:hypothetical protein
LNGCSTETIASELQDYGTYPDWNYQPSISRYHQVTSVGSNIAVNIWWKHLHSFIPSKCGDPSTDATLNQFQFSSLEKNGDDDAADDDDDPDSLM